MARLLLLLSSSLLAAPAFWTQKSIGPIPVAPFTLARVDTLDVDSARVAGLSDSAKALARYARTSAVHDTADSVRAYVRARIEDSLAGYLPLAAGASSPLTGELYASQGVRVGANMLLRDLVGVAGFGAVYGTTNSPTDANYLLAFQADGSEAYFNGTSKIGLDINGNDMVFATAAGVTLAGTTTLSALGAGFVRSSSAGLLSSSALVAGDLPATITSNTTGSAATLTTPRTLTIGSTGKAFNGSANVSWSLAEIGAAPAHSVSANYLLKSNGSGGIAQSVIADDGTGVALANAYIQPLPGYTTTHGGIHGAGLALKTSSNAALWWTKDGSATVLGSTATTALGVNGIDIATATSTGLAVTGGLSATSLAGTGTRMTAADASGALGAASGITISGGQHITTTGSVYATSFLPTQGIVGITNGTSAGTGYVGQIVSVAVAAGSAVNINSTSATSPMSITLGPGEWMISGTMNHYTNNVTGQAAVEGCINTTIAMLTDGYQSKQAPGAYGAIHNSMPVGGQTYAHSSTTTYYMVAKLSATVDQATAWGHITAIRIR